MRKTYFNTEVRVATVADLEFVAGKPGKRAFVEDSEAYYFYAPDRTWKLDDGYKKYSCQLFQNGSSGTPYDNVLGNHTLSDYITWDRVDTGIYRGTLEGAFPEYKTQFIYSGLVAHAVVPASPPEDPYTTFVSVRRVDDDTIMVHVSDSNLAYKDGLTAFDLEIRVYYNNSLRD